MLLVVLVLGVGRWVVAQASEGVVASTEEASEDLAGPQSIAAENSGFLYGRVTLDDGTVHEGRMRFGRDEEALWSHYFNGFKKVNPWVELVPDDLRPTDHRSLKLLGVEFVSRDVPRDLGRPFMARFGDISRIDAHGRDLRVTLKSGTVFDLDRFAADDFADGLTLWDAKDGMLELGEWGVRSIEFLPARSVPLPGAVPLHGTVRTAEGDFTGLIQWNREEALVTDALDARTEGAEVSLSFESIESIERTSGGALVALRHGETLELSGSQEVGDGHRGIYVDDARYGRVLVSWQVFERVDFSSAGSVRGYQTYLPGGPLVGTVTTTSGRALVGRLVYDLDESETTETLDAPRKGVDYMVPFSMIASIGRADPPADVADHVLETVVLTSGETLRFEPAGDLSDSNAGFLVFASDAPAGEYVPWSDVRRVDFRVPSGTEVAHRDE